MANSYRDVPLANKTLLIGLSRNPAQWVLNEDVESEILKIKAKNRKRTKIPQSRKADAKKGRAYEEEPRPGGEGIPSRAKRNTLPCILKPPLPFGKSGVKKASSGPWLWRPLPLRPKVRKLERHKKHCRFCHQSFDKDGALKNHLGQKHKKERKLERHNQAQVFNTAQKELNDQVCSEIVRHF